MTQFVRHKILAETPRLPLEGEIDLTYRCNNDCRHCWVKEPGSLEVQERELADG